MKKYNKKKIVKTFGIVLIAIATIFGSVIAFKNFNEKLTSGMVVDIENLDCLFLSDIDYITTNNWSYNGWSGHAIQKDKNPEGGTIQLLVNGEKIPFSKGLGLHAKGQITYDISEYSTKFTRFTSKIGVDASRTKDSSIWFQIFVSDDGNTWTSMYKSDIIYPNQESINIDINIEGKKYLRIYVDPAGSNTSDHGVLANASLVTEDYVTVDVPYDKLKRLAYYDNILSAQTPEYNYENNYRLILEREFVRKIGFWAIQDIARTNPAALEALNWILSDNEILEQVIEVGEISNVYTFLDAIGKLYTEYKDALATENGYVYQKMMIGLAAAYSTDRVISPLAFSFQSSSTYDYMERFKLMKELFDNNQLRRVKINALAGEFIQNDWFKDYHVELMRMVMQDGTSNIDLVWLNGYTNEKQSVSFYMIPYISPNYNQARFYDEANRELYDNKYFLSKYNVPYGVRVARYWMVIEGGGICWNASRFGQSMYRVNGIPATGAYQPGHELYIQYYEDANGNGYWTPRYGNWGWAGSTWGGANPYRYIFNWNNKYFADRHISGSKGASNTGYLYLGQANLNRLEQYQESLYYNLIANSYTDNNQKLASYFKALEVNDLNLDSYDGIINVYKEMSVQNEGGTITSHEWYDLANKIIEAYKFHPVAMFDLLKVIRPYLEGWEKLYIDRLEKETLTRATRVTASDTIQVDGVRTHANQLLNKAQPDPITFSFDGEDGGKLVKNPMYSLAWSYSLDGGNTYTEYKMDDAIALTKEELASITEDNDIIIRFMGLTNYTFRIDITKGTISNLLFANDLENRVIGIDLTYEWRNSESDEWTSYKTASPDNTGNKTLYVRRGYTGTQIASDSVTYTFTADNQPDTRKYVSISHLSIEAVSTEATNNAGAATYAIDGNYNTRWHSAWNGSDTQRFITIKLDKPRYISAVEFVPAGGGNGRINDGTIWGCKSACENDANWKILSQRTGITYSAQANTIEQAKQFTQNFAIDDPQEVQYIKIVADRTNGNWFTARAFNIFQDLTKEPRPTGGVGYSTTEPTRENVIARLVNVSVSDYDIIDEYGNVIEEGGDTHIFTENKQSYTFRFRDRETGLIGTSEAYVDWIDREAPTATIEYSTTSPTANSVIATLKPSEDIIITNNSEYKVDEEGNIVDKDGNILEGYTIDEEGNLKDADGNFVTNLNAFTYEFYGNAEFTFEFMDKAGNKGSATAKVTWIDSNALGSTLYYDIDKVLTNKDVTVTISFNKEGAFVTNNDGNLTYTFTENGKFTFEYRDNVGNIGSATAEVTWIDKEAPTAELKYEKTDHDSIIVSVINASEDITFKTGDGTYEYDRNGSYDIIFYDLAGNETKLVAVIEGLKKNNSHGGNSGSTNDDNNKPTNPDDNNNSDDNNNKPAIPDDNKPIIDDSNKPNNGNNNNSNSNNNNSSNSNNNNNNSNNNNTIIDNDQEEYVQYSVNNVILEIPNRVAKENLIFRKALLALPSSLQEVFNSDSEYFELYFENGNQELEELNADETMKIMFKLDDNKRFAGIYKIREDNSISPLDCERVNNNQILIKTKALGKYVITYKKDVEVVNPETPNPDKPITEEINNNLVSFIVPVVIASSICVIILKKKHDDKY